MNGIAIVFVYIGMLLFDAAILAGTAFLIQDHQWSPWWMLFAFMMCVGSNPKTAISALKAKDEE